MTMGVMIAVGLACGIAASLPMALHVERRISTPDDVPSVGYGLLYVMVSFAVLSVLVGIVSVVSPDSLAAFGGSMGISFALVWLVFGIRSAIMLSRQGH
jgi:hypothetical protein